MLLFFKKLGVIIIALFALALSGCSGKTDGGSYVVSIDGSQVSVNEYMIYLRETVKSFEAIGGEDIWETDFDGRNAFDVARENAMNSLVMVKLSVAQAVKASGGIVICQADFLVLEQIGGIISLKFEQPYCTALTIDIGNIHFCMFISYFYYTYIFLFCQINF